jgi:hypothetical protein
MVVALAKLIVATLWTEPILEDAGAAAEELTVKINVKGVEDKGAYEVSLDFVAITTQLPDVAALATLPISEQPVAVPLEIAYATLPVPEPPWALSV